jgi:aryl-alcohol dehydrogenase-like predicted oxidoreductase
MNKAGTSSIRESLFPTLTHLAVFILAFPNVLTTLLSANGYQAEESETWVGEWLTTRGLRDEIVLATKYTAGFKTQSEPKKLQSNFGGCGSKSLHVSVEASLKKLQTSYIDLLYVHYWDMATSVEELMQSLNVLVRDRKVLYLGISDAPAWWVVKCNEYAKHHGLRQFSVYQGRWSAATRDMEREIVPMCLDQGMSMAIWGAIGGGYFKPKSQRGQAGGRSMNVRSSKDEEVADVLEKISERTGNPMTSLALAWVMSKAPHVFPIVGGRKVDHLQGNIEALSLELSDEEVKEIDEAYGYEAGFPYDFLGGGRQPKGPAEVVFNQRFGNFDQVEPPKAIKPHKGPLSTHDPAPR